MVVHSIHVAMILYVRILNVWRHVRGKITSWVAVRGEGGVAGEGTVVGVPKYHSWGKCTMPLTNVNSDWMSNASSSLWITLLYLLIYIMRVLYLASELCFFLRHLIVLQLHWIGLQLYWIVLGALKCYYIYWIVLILHWSALHFNEMVLTSSALHFSELLEVYWINLELQCYVNMLCWTVFLLYWIALLLH